MPESKEIRNALSKCRARALEAERQLMTESPHALVDKAYLVLGTDERSGYNVGYFMAMRDILALLEGGDMPSSLRPPSPSVPVASPGGGSVSPSR